MIEVLKTLHFLSLWVAGGIGVGGWIIQHVHMKNGARPSLEVVQSLRLMGFAALCSVLVLWVTGYLMMQQIYAGVPPLAAFHAKLLAAVCVLLGSLGTNLETLRSMRAGTPPRAGIMNALAWTVRIALLAVLIATSVAFA